MQWVRPPQTTNTKEVWERRNYDNLVPRQVLVKRCPTNCWWNVLDITRKRKLKWRNKYVLSLSDINSARGSNSLDSVLVKKIRLRMKKLFSRNFKETAEVTLTAWEMAQKNSPHRLEDSKMACLCSPEKTSNVLRYQWISMLLTSRTKVRDPQHQGMNPRERKQWVKKEKEKVAKEERARKSKLLYLICTV